MSTTITDIERTARAEAPPYAALCNIVNNTLRPPAMTRQQGGWVLPVTPAHEMAFALKCVRRRQIMSIDKIIDGLSAIGRQGSWITDQHLLEIARNSGSPIKYMRRSIRRLNDWLASIGEFVAREARPLPAGVFAPGDPHRASILMRGGRALVGGLPSVLVLAGDEVALPPWVLAHAVLANANAIAKPSGVEPLSSQLFCRALIEQGLLSPNLIHLSSASEEDRALLQDAIRQTEQSVVFGEDASVNAIYGGLEFLPRHKPIPYWTGRSGAIVLPDADIDLAAQAILVGATEDRGNRCISTKKVFAPRAVAAALEARLVAAADGLVRGSPLDDRTDLGTVDAEAHRIAEGAVQGTKVLYERDLIITCCEPGARLLRMEPPYPVVSLCYYDEGQDPVQMANATVAETPLGRAVAMAVFTDRRHKFVEVAARLLACKVMHNLPSSHWDIHSTHQAMHLFLELMREKEIG